MNTQLRSFKRTCVHNICVTSSNAFSDAPVVEGLTLSPILMKLCDIAPYERIVVTKQGGDNWRNRIYTIAIPGEEGKVEARGCLSHLLKPGDLCCIISATYLSSEQYDQYCLGKFPIPTIDIRFYYQDGSFINNMSTLKTTLEFSDKQVQVDQIDAPMLDERKKIPRIMLSNIVSRLRVSQIERQCLEMNAELPFAIMQKAGLVRNQTIFVFNASRGGISAESFVVPNTRDNHVVISGALSNVADIGDIVSEAAFVITQKIEDPVVLNL